MCEICSKLAIMTPEQRHCRRSGVFIVNFEQISYPFSSDSIDDFEKVNACLVEGKYMCRVDNNITVKQNPEILFWCHTC